MPPHFAYPFRREQSGHAVVTEQGTVDHIADQIEAALITRLGQRDERPLWGTPDLTFTQQPVDIDALTSRLVELVPSAALVLEERPDVLDELVMRLQINVSTTRS